MHSPPKDPSLHRRFFGCLVRFNSLFEGFVVPAADLDRVSRDADAALAGFANNLLDSLPG